jgi:glycosyltransferase involved in cell wall biosynthesis
MIVKDEEKDIERCLKSVHKYIDYWVIIDTGSKDKTIKKIKSLMKNRFKVPGELHERPWVDFSHNRNEALEIAETKGDYVMFMDADDIFKPEKGFNLDFLNHDFFMFFCPFKMKNLDFERCIIIKSNESYRYTGVLHEFIAAQDNKPSVMIPNCHMEANASPLKRFPTKKEKYLNDAKILEDSLRENPDSYRDQFYLAQCFFDAGDIERSEIEYQKRVDMGTCGAEDEVYLALYRIAGCKVKLNKPKDDVLKYLSLAWELIPYRMEAPSLLMSALLRDGRFFMAFTYGEMTLKAQKLFGSHNNLFKIPSTETDLFPKYYGIAAENCGFYEIASASYKVLLENNPPTIKRNELEKKIKELEAKCSV